MLRSVARSARAVTATGARALSTSVAPMASQAAPRVGALFGTVALGAGLAYTASGVVHADAAVDYKAVREAIADILEDEKYDDGSIGPVLVRLAWHASGSYNKATNTGGSNGANMRFMPESGYGANAGLNIARDRLEAIKKSHPGITYADLYTLAAVVAIEEMGGPEIDWSPGRSDSVEGKHYKVPDGRLPDAAQGASHVRDIFYAYGFNDQEITALAGAHALGRCHPDRSGFEGPWTRAPTTFSNEYFRLLLEEKWIPGKSSAGQAQFWDPKHELMMLPADMAFRDDPAFRKWTELYAKDEDRFFADFSAAFSKLLNLGVPAKSGGGVMGWLTSWFK